MNGERKMRVSLITLILVAIPFFLPHPDVLVRGQESGEEWFFPPLQITYDGRTKEVSVEPGANNTFEVSGTITADYRGRENDTREFFVQLMVYGHLIEDHMTQMIPISKNRSSEFYSIEVNPSYGSDADLSAEIQIKAYAYFPDDPSTKLYLGRGPITLRIRPYGAVSVERTVISGRIPVGEWRTIDLNIINEGNGNDRYNITVISSSKKVEYELNEGKLTIEKGGERNIEMRVRQKSGLSRSNTIRVEVSSIFPGRNNRTVIDIQFATKWSPRVLSGWAFLPYLGAFFVLGVAVLTWVMVFRTDIDKNHSIPKNHELDQRKTIKKVTRAGKLK